MKILRTHHIVCSLAHKGHGYNAKSIEGWHSFMQDVHVNPDVPIRITSEPDLLCQSCPGISSVTNPCKKFVVSQLDNAWQQILDLKNDGVYLYSKLAQMCNEKVTPEVHKSVCGGCAWWRECENTFKK